MKSSFSEADLGNFVRNLISSGSGLEKLKVELAFKKADPWDGKDAAPIEEDYDYGEYEDL